MAGRETSVPGKGGGGYNAEDNCEPVPTPLRPSHLYLWKTGHLWGSDHLWQVPCWGVQVGISVANRKF